MKQVTGRNANTFPYLANYNAPFILTPATKPPSLYDAAPSNLDAQRHAYRS